MRGLKEDERREANLFSHQEVPKEISEKKFKKFSDIMRKKYDELPHEIIINMTNSLKSRCFLKLSTLKSELMGRFKSWWLDKELDAIDRHYDHLLAIETDAHFCRSVGCDFDKKDCVCYPVFSQGGEEVKQ